MISQWTWLALTFFAFFLILETLVEFLNLSKITNKIPVEFQHLYDPEKYRKSQSYLQTNTFFGLVSDHFHFFCFITFWLLSGFEWVDQLARSYQWNSVLTGLLFFGILGYLQWMLALPFGIYHTFVIEKNFGFNKTTAKTYIGDQLKGLLLTCLIGAPILAAILWFFESFAGNAWLYVWIFLTVVTLFMMFIAPVTIMPLFNKFTPLEEGELKSAINEFAKKENFYLQGIYKMDGSKRSTRANAYFTGFGKFKRIVLFDTLIEKHTTEELVAILAHEIGHFKLKHIWRQLTLSLATSFVTLFIFNQLLQSPFLFEAFRVSQPSVYAGLLFLSLLFSPISSILSLWNLALSRKYEFEADEYSVRTYGKPLALSEALKKLSVENLSNLHPHPLKVFLEYTHPPVMKRTKVLESLKI
ncbi:MAG: M48 family metallopeptidase [Bdellovibrionales bacterium]